MSRGANGRQLTTPLFKKVRKMKKSMIISKEMVTFAELIKQSTMKRIVLTLVALLGMVSAWSQTDEISKEQADKLNAITLKLMEQKRYDDAIKAKERELVILKSLYGETDSTYIKQFAFSAKLYYRNEQAAEAASVIEKAANLYATHVSNNDAMYAHCISFQPRIVPRQQKTAGRH